MGGWDGVSKVTMRLWVSKSIVCMVFEHFAYMISVRLKNVKGALFGLKQYWNNAIVEGRNQSLPGESYCALIKS